MQRHFNHGGDRSVIRTLDSLQSVYSLLLRKTSNDAVAIRENVVNTHFSIEVMRIKTLLLSLLFGSMCRGNDGILVLKWLH